MDNAKRHRQRWHGEMTPRAIKKALGLCQRCGRATGLGEGVIHHNTYVRGCYDEAVEQFMDSGVCVWLCNGCHYSRHLEGGRDISKLQAAVLRTKKKPLDVGARAKWLAWWPERKKKID